MVIIPHNEGSLLKNPLEEVIRERKVPLPSGTDAQSGLKRGLERATNKLRKATKNEQRWDHHEKRRDIGEQELERQQEAFSRQEAGSRGPSHKTSLHEQELLMPPMRHAER